MILSLNSNDLTQVTLPNFT